MEENQLADVGNTTQIAEHSLRVLVAAFNRRAGVPMNGTFGSAPRYVWRNHQ